jgi:Flp pilus assembly pilin Flp
LRKLLSLWQRKDGASAVEYALLVGLITLAIAVSVNAMGKSLSGTFSTVAKAFNAQTGKGNTGGASAGTGTAAGKAGKTAQPGKASPVGSALVAPQAQ